jgi:hypothetical protein
MLSATHNFFPTIHDPPTRFASDPRNAFLHVHVPQGSTRYIALPNALSRSVLAVTNALDRRRAANHPYFHLHPKMNNFPRGTTFSQVFRYYFWLYAFSATHALHKAVVWVACWTDWLQARCAFRSIGNRKFKNRRHNFARFETIP